MPVIGIRMEKIQAERKENVKIEGQMRIMPTSRILQVQETQIPGVTGRVNVLEVSFEYATSYDPPVGEIKITGTVIFQEADAVRKQLLETWKEQRSLHPEIGREIFYRMAQHAFLVMMNLARELSLPSPLPMKLSTPEEGA